MRNNKSFRSLAAYLLFFIPIAIVILSAWYFLVDGRLYYCTDKLPIMDFIPPFIHDGVGDYFISSPFLVFSIWIVLMFVMFLAPFFLSKRLVTETQRTRHKPVKRKK